MPREFVSRGEWPNATLTGDAPAHAHAAQTLARDTARAIAESGRSIRAVAKDAGVTHATVLRVINGEACATSAPSADSKTLSTLRFGSGPRATVESLHSVVGDVIEQVVADVSDAGELVEVQDAVA
jgi:hypothetical protein